MEHLNRREFLDLAWDAADLDAAAQFWVRLYEAAASGNWLAPSSGHVLQLRLQGFPRHQAGELLAELERRLAAVPREAGYESPHAFQSDPDTITLSTGDMRVAQPPPSGLAVSLLAGPPFDGLFVMVRFRIAGLRCWFSPRAKPRATLVLVGELRGGCLLLKAVWRTGANRKTEELFWHTPWPEQGTWLNALEQFRKTGAVPSKLASGLFAFRWADSVGALSVGLIRLPLGKPRLAGLLIRLLMFPALLVVLGLASYRLAQREEWAPLIPVLGVGSTVFYLAWVFARNQARLWFDGYRRMRGGLARVYEGLVKHVTLTREEAVARLDNTWARKYTQELEAAGFIHAGDLQLETERGSENTIRVFHAPDGVSYLNLLFITATGPGTNKPLRMWPATVSFLAYTFFTDGGRASSTGGRSSGYRKKRTGPGVRHRQFSDIECPVEFGRRHMATAGAFAQETGRRPLGTERLELYVHRLQAMHEEARQDWVDAQYTWGDHWYWFLQVPRREYRE